MKMINKNWMSLTFFVRNMIIFWVDIEDRKRLVIHPTRGLV